MLSPPVLAPTRDLSKLLDLACAGLGGLHDGLEASKVGALGGQSLREGLWGWFFIDSRRERKRERERERETYRK